MPIPPQRLQNLPLSVGQDCEQVIEAQRLLEGPPQCFSASYVD